MTKQQAEKLFDSWLEKAETKGKNKEEYALHCLKMLNNEFIEWFGYEPKKEAHNE